MILFFLKTIIHERRIGTRISKPSVPFYEKKKQLKLSKGKDEARTNLQSNFHIISHRFFFFLRDQLADEFVAFLTPGIPVVSYQVFHCFAKGLLIFFKGDVAEALQLDDRNVLLVDLLR